MKYVLDTDILIYFLKGFPNVVSKIASNPLENLTTTIVNHTELLFGAFNSTKRKQNLDTVQTFLNKFSILSFCEESSFIFAEQKALLKKQGNIVADLDLMIASIALKHQYVLVTNNIKHFARIRNLKVQNWNN